MAITEKNQVQQLLAAAAEACDERKAEDIRILALDPAESGLTDYFLICSGNSDRQNVAITDAIEIKLKQQFGVYPNSVEGRRQGEWILMDYVDFIVHVFSVEKRAFYGLERLRKTATVLSLADLNAQLALQTKAVVAAGRKKVAVGKKTLPAKKSAAKKPAAKKATTRKTATKTASKAAAKPAKKATKSAVKKATKKK